MQGSALGLGLGLGFASAAESAVTSEPASNVKDTEAAVRAQLVKMVVCTGAFSSSPHPLPQCPYHIRHLSNSLHFSPFLTPS
jgi:hypothetical protein